MVEHNAIWSSHLTRLYRVAPEHVRILSSHEQVLARDIQELGRNPVQGSGVFQYQDQIQEEVSRNTTGSQTNRVLESIPEVIPNPTPVDQVNQQERERSTWLDRIRPTRQ